MKEWLMKKFPGIYKFFTDFFNGLNNKPGGHSLRKLLAVGFFWLTAVLCIGYTTSDNLAIIVGILTGMITTLVVTYSVSNYKEQKIKIDNTDTIDPSPNAETPEA